MPAISTLADVLNRLLDIELQSPFARAVESVPHVGRHVGLGRAIRYLADADARRTRDLFALLTEHGFERTVGSSTVIPQEAYLSITHLRPAWIEARSRSLQAYRDAIEALAGGPEPILALLRKHLSEHAGELALLQS
jgi:hypothetical protein